MALRFSYFLSQAVYNSRENVNSNIDAVAIARTVFSVLTGAEETVLTNINLRGESMTDEEAEQNQKFWDENIRAIVKLQFSPLNAGVLRGKQYWNMVALLKAIVKVGQTNASEAMWSKAQMTASEAIVVEWARMTASEAIPVEWADDR
ncbi:hypothetical protein CYMTET_29701 [Cymbomonas tetramitiformis]|uniref:Uncharacterized protein n=1 Tax=Cymbomonas tetramitiformis TaxID=36881 RepID=A0AAE0FKR3_9CHLO|nr:hypothetical protein CYMTET_29701 [Cymbomonas tetramitiformis]